MTDEPAPDELETPFLFSDRVWPLAWMGTFLDALAQIPVITLACKTAKVSRQWAHQCKNEFPAFSEAWDEAKNERAPDMFEGTVIRWGFAGIPVTETRTKKVDGKIVEEVITETVSLSPALAKYVLNRFKPEYRDTTRHEHSGPAGGAIQVDHEVLLDEVNRWPTLERTMELARLALEFGIKPRELPLLLEAEPEPDEEADEPPA